jgi:hypothetical protein
MNNINRYLTTTAEDGRIEAWTHWPKGVDSSDVADFIWQFAETPEQAIAQHDIKIDEWRDDIDNGKTAKETY